MLLAPKDKVASPAFILFFSSFPLTAELFLFIFTYKL